MRLKLILQHEPNQVLPINYQYLISSWIYRTLGNANTEYATQLHEHGYDFGGRKYKLFTFSTLHPRWFDINKKAKTFTLSKNPTEIELSFYMDDAVQNFVIGLFRDQEFSLASGQFRADFHVTGIETLAKPVFQPTMQFRLKTPLCIGENEEGKEHAQYRSPEDAGYGELLLRNLLRKQGALTHNPTDDTLQFDFPYDFNLLSTPRSKLYNIKGTKVKGYLFDFELTATKALLEIGYFGGFGEKNSSLGMGMVRGI